MLPETIELISQDGRRTTYVLRPERSEDGTPLYEIAGSGMTASPTGSIWVRFAEGVDAGSRAAELEAAGYRIERIPGYAPNAAFVRAADLETSLTRLDALRALADVELVEPQMLTARNFR